LLCLWLGWKETRQTNEAAAVVHRRLLRISIWMLPLGAGLGGVGLLLVWASAPEPYFRGINAVPMTRYVSSAIELGFSFGCLWLAQWMWNTPLRRSAWRIWTARFLILLAATNLMYHFPSLFLVISTLSQRPDAWQAPFDFIGVLSEPENLARLLHHFLALLVTSAIMMMGIVQRPRIDGARAGQTAHPHDGAEEAEPAQRNDEAGSLNGSVEVSPLARLGISASRLALVMAVLQIPLGLYLIMRIASATRNQFMGGDLLATVSFVIGVAAVFGLLHHLALSALGDTQRGTVARSMFLLTAVLLFMVLTRHRSREEAYERIREQRPAVQRPATRQSTSQDHRFVSSGKPSASFEAV
jgi:hypothetical protein